MDFLQNIDWGEVIQACLDTLTMLGYSLGLTVLIGLPLGIVLYLTGQPKLLNLPVLYRVLSFVINIMRSLPFIILLIVLIPFTTFVTGTSLGVQGTIPPLVAGCAPFFARLVETSLREVEPGLIEASTAMGGSTWQLIWFTLLPEARSSLLAAGTVTAIVLVDYTSMAGVIGGGGLGDLAIRFGYQRFQTDVMVVTVVMLIALVQILQMSGDRLVRYFSRR